jgi:hypothetical protein
MVLWISIDILSDLFDALLALSSQPEGARSAHHADL